MFRNKTFRLGAGSLFFLVFCQTANYLLSPPFLCNSGIGLGVNIPIPVLIPIISFSLIAASFLIWKGILQDSPLSFLALSGGALLLGGALSNVANRLIQGCVPDFFHLSWFPAFNMADISISLGAILLLASSMYKKDVRN